MTAGCAEVGATRLAPAGAFQQLFLGVVPDQMNFGQVDPVAAEVGGVRFNDTATVGGKELKLNGVGMRTKFFIALALLHATEIPVPDATGVIYLGRSTTG